MGRYTPRMDFKNCIGVPKSVDTGQTFDEIWTNGAASHHPP